MDWLNIYVGNLEQSVEKKDLLELFSEFSPTTAIVKYRHGYVNVPNEFKEKAIKKLNGTVFKGQKIIVDNPRSKFPKESIREEIENKIGLTKPTSWKIREVYGTHITVGGDGIQEHLR